jgi:glycosyltransferase involved in cell wall biosynthesis
VDIASALDAEKFQPVVVLERDAPPVYSVGDHVTLRRLSAVSTRKAFWPLVRTLRAERPDVVYAALPHLNILTAAALPLVRRPAFVASVHNNQARELPQLPDGALLGKLIPFSYRSADAVVGVSTGVADEARNVFGAGDKARVIYNPIDTEAIRTAAQQPIPHPWLTGDHTVLVAMGRLAEQKNYPLLLRSMAELHHQEPNARLLILGDGPLRSELIELGRELGIAEIVDFVGVQQNPFSYIARADVFVMTSKYEGFGMALVEAMALGTPVASTDCDYGPREILQDGRSGLLLADESTQGVAGSLLSLLSDSDRCAHLGAAGKLRANDFDISVIAPQTGELLSSVLKNRTPRRFGART